MYMKFGKCSKILNNSCLLKRPRQTVQTQIRLLLKKQSDQGLPCLLFYRNSLIWVCTVCYSDKHFVNLKTNISLENKKRKVFKILECFPKVPKSHLIDLLWSLIRVFPVCYSTETV